MDLCMALLMTNYVVYKRCRMLRYSSSRAPEGRIISRQFCGSFSGCNASSSRRQLWCLKSWIAVRRRICQTTDSLSAPPAADSYRLSTSKQYVCYNVGAYHYPSRSSGFCCCRTATVEQSPRRSDLSIGQFRRARALKTRLFCWWLRRLVTSCFMAPCINLLYLLTDFNVLNCFLLHCWASRIAAN